VPAPEVGHHELAAAEREVRGVAEQVEFEALEDTTFAGPWPGSAG
jgi:hypothetical protein